LVKKINIGLLGFGTVGSGVYRILTENNKNITERIKRDTGKDIEINIKRVLVRNKKKYGSVLEDIGTENIEDILNDDEISIVVEVIGGSEPAIGYMKYAMIKKKNVVTANKRALFEEKGRLEDFALNNSVQFRYEASVGGVLPIVRVLKESQISDELEELSAIINGSTNYILTRTAKGESIDEVIKNAKQLGYLEADPTSDLEGFDPMYKIGILGYILTGKYPEEHEIERRGITGITPDDVLRAEEHGAVIKLVGKIKKEDAIGNEAKSKYTYSVKPELITKENPLFDVNGSLNAVNMQFRYANDMFISGRGAGCLETGTAVVSDIVSIAKLL